MKRKQHVRRMNMGIFIILMSLLSINAMAQQQKISGKVADAAGEGLTGVSIFVKGTSTGSITDINGNFSIILPENAKSLAFTYIGYKPQEVQIGSQRTFSIVMVEDSRMLEEVVAIGYGVQKKSDLTGASSRLTDKDMNKSVA